MKCTVFAKRRKTANGKEFTSYMTRLAKKDGSEQAMSVAFREDFCKAPKLEECPCIIEFAKENANISKREYEREDTGERGTSFTLWITDYTMTGEKWVDHSLDEFAD